MSTPEPDPAARTGTDAPAPDGPLPDRRGPVNRLRNAVLALVVRAQTVTVLGYMGVISFIGVEALIVVLGFTTVLPIAIPFVLIAMAAAYFFRERLRALWTALRAKRDRRPAGD
ncbi:hypothetical protein [Glycomyces albidus]|jgi:hypothetical protein|uniref:Uncharacterized protein n=1 Tax=Glycomyces albidus TaxID=2656774 RepID=A0A6L5G8X4_9ACTN|nr:hypothetical protein [Glycomyces albidus]MQM26095.1 hypothetical protein [Glycomyces albidus]